MGLIEKCNEFFLFDCSKVDQKTIAQKEFSTNQTGKLEELLASNIMTFI